VASTDVTKLVDESTFDSAGRPGLTYRRIRGVRVVLEWVARRLLAPRDGLPWALATCIDLPGYVNASMTAADIAALKSACDSEVTRVEYVTSARCTMALGADGVLRYRVEITVANAGNYPLAVTIDEAGAVLVQFPIAGF